MDMVSAVGLWPLLGGAILLFGFAPGLVVRIISLCFEKDDPRRREMIAEVYAVPRWSRPFWVAEQAERALTEGLWERLYWSARGRLFDRVRYLDGTEMNREHPDSFWIPSDAEKADLRPGDLVKINFISSGWGERMWVKVTKVGPRRVKGTLANHPVGVYHHYFGKRISFKRMHIIDIDRPEPSPARVLER